MLGRGKQVVMKKIHSDSPGILVANQVKLKGVKCPKNTGNNVPSSDKRLLKQKISGKNTCNYIRLMDPDSMINELWCEKAMPASPTAL